MALTEKELDDLKTKSTRYVAREWGVKEEDVRALRRKNKIPSPTPPVRTFTIPTFTIPKLLVTSDWHVPYHDEERVAEVVRVAEVEGIKVVLAVGDVIDLPTLSRFDPRDIDSNVGMELSTVGDVLDEFTSRGIQVIWSRGNHENRFFKALKHQVDMSDLIQLCGVDPTMVYGLEGEEVYVKSGDTTWLFTHQGEYSRVPLSVARRLVDKYRCNVGTAHNHQYAYGKALDGVHEVLELGGLFNTDKMAYLHRGGASTFPHQQQGFWIIEQGEVRKP